MSVLVVDDDPGIRDMLAQVLEDEGHGVVIASNGLEAIDHLQHSAERPCVILLDLMMPIMNGWQFRSEQKQHPELAAIPVVVLSARTDIQQQASTLDVDTFIAKPINIGMLLDTVGRYCGPRP